MNVFAEKKCPACLGANVSSFGNKNRYTLVRCAECQTVFVVFAAENDQSPGEIEEIYNHYYDAEHFELLPATEFSLQSVVKSFEDFRQTGKMLDIGFGQGAMLSVAEKNNWQCYGTEISPQALEYGKNRGWKVAADAFADARFEKESFDAVTMIEVIEHVPDPEIFLRTAWEMLRPNGLFYLTTPNIKSINGRYLGIDWSVVSPPEHLILWSPRGLKTALARNKFETRKIRADGFNPIEIYGKYKSARKSKAETADKPLPSRNEAAFALNAAFSSSPWRRAVKSSINSGLTAFHLGDGMKIRAIKKV